MKRRESLGVLATGIACSRGIFAESSNVKSMESFALPIFRAGHMPVLGEWLALPFVHLAGSRRIGDDVFNEIFHPIAIRLLDKCDAVLRVGGPSAGADEMVRIARERGLDVYSALEGIPGCSERAAINPTRPPGRGPR